MAEEIATFGAGCFWGVEEAFRTLEGVTSTRVGFAGGTTDAPSYRDVCTGKTGHAEVVEVNFDPAVISYETLLDTFWHIHDPTQLNRQGPDVGTQYRSVIFTHSREQAARAQQSLKHAEHRFSNPIATRIETAPTFWEAEEYHQKYVQKQGGHSCSI